MQSNGWESGQSGNNSSEDDGAGVYMTLKALTVLDLIDRVLESEYQWCCGKRHKKGRNLKQVSS